MSTWSRTVTAILVLLTLGGCVQSIMASTTPIPVVTETAEKMAPTATPDRPIRQVAHSTPESLVIEIIQRSTDAPRPVRLRDAVTIDQMMLSLDLLEETDVVPLEDLPEKIVFSSRTTVFFRETSDIYDEILPPTWPYTVRQLRQIIAALKIYRSSRYLKDNLPDEIHFTNVDEIARTTYEDYDINGKMIKLKCVNKDEPLIVGVLWVGKSFKYFDLPQANGDQDIQFTKGVGVLVHEMMHAVALHQRMESGSSEVLALYTGNPVLPHTAYPEEDLANSAGRFLTGYGLSKDVDFWNGTLELATPKDFPYALN